VKYVDADGNSITKEQFVELFMTESYRQLRRTTVHKRWWVATVWLGVDLATAGRPLYFETVVQDIQDPEHLQSLAKYATKGAALAGHNRLVNQIRAGRLHPFSKK